MVLIIMQFFLTQLQTTGNITSGKSAKLSRDHQKK